LLLACVAFLPGQAARGDPLVPSKGSAGAPAPAGTDCYGDPLPAGAVARLGTIRLRHSSGAACVVFSPDGKTLILGGDGLWAWDVATGKEMRWFSETAPATSARFTADGKTLVAADNTGTIHRWDVGTGKLLRTTVQPLNGARSPMASFFSGDGRVVGVYGAFGDVWLLDADTGELTLHTERSRLGLPAWAALSPDGKLVALPGEGNFAHLIDAATGKDVRTVAGRDPARPFCLEFSPDGRLLAAAGKHAVSVWEVATGKLRYESRGVRGRLGFSPDGRTLACGNDGAIVLLDAADGKPVRRFEEGPVGPVACLAFSPDGKNLAAAGHWTVSLWDVATGKRRLPFAGHEHLVTSLAFSSDGAALASGESDGGQVIVWDVASRRPRYSCPGHSGDVLALAFSSDGRTLATGDGLMGGGTGGFDARIRVWSAADGRLLRQFPGHLNSVQSLAFAPDGKVLASAGRDARARLWDVATGKRLLQIRGADSKYRAVSFSPDGTALLVAGSEGQLALWRADSGQKLRDLGPPDGAPRLILQAAYLPGGTAVLSTEFPVGRPSSGEVRVWDGASARLVRSFPVHGVEGSFPWFALSHDGKMLAATGNDSLNPVVRVWDTATGDPVARVRAHPGGNATALAFSPDGKLLATGGRDTTVLLWDVRQARLDYLWSELAGGRGEAAQGLNNQAGSAAEAVTYLQERLRRAAAAEGAVESLAADLDDESFEVRDRASREMEPLGPEAVFALRAALERSTSVEARSRIQKALARIKKSGDESPGITPQGIRLAVALLEENDIPEARRALEELAKGPATSLVSREARAALERRAKRPKSP
jgi:WD40 repeat protein